MKILGTEQIQRAISRATLQRALVRLAGGRKASSAKGWRRWWTQRTRRLTQHAEHPRRPKVVPLSQGERVALALLGQWAAADSTRAGRLRAALASRRFARLPDAHKPRPLMTALTVEPARLRVFAAGELARLGDPRAVRPLLARVLREPSPRARRALAEAAGRLAAPGAVGSLVQALDSHDEVRRRRAAEALGHLGDLAAVPHLLARWEARAGDFPRVHMSHVRQLSYIQDFDVEVSKTSWIADPVVGVIPDGTALPVKILATEQVGRFVQTAVLQQALVTLAGGRKATNPKGWRAWNAQQARPR